MYAVENEEQSCTVGSTQALAIFIVYVPEN